MTQGTTSSVAVVAGDFTLYPLLFSTSSIFRSTRDSDLGAMVLLRGEAMCGQEKPVFLHVDRHGLPVNRTFAATRGLRVSHDHR